MFYQADFIKEYDRKNSSKKEGVFTTIFMALLLMVTELILIARFLSFSLPKKVLLSNPDYLSCTINKSEVTTLENSVVSLEKYYKLSPSEIGSLNRYIGKFKYEISPDYILNNIEFEIGDNHTPFRLVAIHSNTYLNSAYNFDDYAYNELIINESFKLKYGGFNEIKWHISHVFEHNGIYDFIQMDDVFYINEIISDSLIFAEPTCYINIEKFNYYLSTIVLENISASLDKSTSLYDLLNLDVDGRIFNNYDYVLGLKSYEDLMSLYNLCETSIYNISSVALSNKEQVENVFEIVNILSNIFTIVSIFSVALFVAIFIYISYTRKRNVLGLLFCLGKDYRTCFDFTSNKLLKLTLNGLIIYGIINVISLLIMNIIRVDILNYGILILLVLCLAVLFICSIYFISYLAFKILTKRNNAILVGED